MKTTTTKKGEKPSKNDPVNHPAHYTDGKIEVIDFIEDKNLGYHLGSVVKYVARAGKKDPAKHVQDLQKAAWYLNRHIENLKKIKMAVLALFISLSGFSQITLENSYTGYCQVFKINDTDFVYSLYKNREAYIYSSSHALLKEVALAGSPKAQQFGVLLVSKKLFNTDEEMEIAYWYQDSMSYTLHSAITTESGTELFNDTGSVSFVKAGTKAKMILNKTNGITAKAKVFSLPGEYIPTTTGKKESDTKTVSPYPNPAYDFITLPYNITGAGSLIIYNSGGQEVLKYAIDSSFKDLLVNTSILSPGIYFYKTVSGSVTSAAQQFIISK